MSTGEETTTHDDSASGSASAPGDGHPVFTALSGFFTGLALVLVVPGGFAAVLSLMFSSERAEELFPFVLLLFAVPIVLITVPRTRRFGGYLLLGMLLTAVVVVGVAALVLWLLVRGG